MSSDLPLIAAARAMAAHASARHRVIAGNVANADTPGYKARDLGPFDAYAALRAARADETPRRAQARILTGMEASHNGNTVSLEDQMVRAAEARLQHQTALGIYKKSLDLLRLGLGRR